MKFILKNWLFLTAGLVLTAICVKVAYEERGYIAVGGEWLVFPCMVTIRALARSVVEDIVEGISDEYLLSGNPGKGRGRRL